MLDVSKYLVRSVAEGEISHWLCCFSDLFFRVGESEYFREYSIGEPSLDQVESRIGCLQIRNQAILSSS